MLFLNTDLTLNLSKYDYWNQPAGYDSRKDGSDEDYEPKERGKEEEKSDELIEEFKDDKLKTFYEEVKIEWDKSKYNVCVVETIKSGHTGYKIKGVDGQGEFDIVRRFREFYALRSTLRKRWIGFYVPGIPPKKPIGNKDESTINERWYLFNRFMQEISLIPYLWESEEMKAFIRPKLDVEKNLGLMGSMTSEQILDRLMTHSGIDYDTAASMTSKYKDQLRDFVLSSKEIFKFLEGFKNFAKQVEKIRKMQIIAHGKFGGLLSKYEESTVAVYGLSDFSNNRVFSNTEDSSSRDCIDQIAKKLDNPYRNFKHWIKEEIIDFHALVEAIAQRELLESLKNKTENKKRSSQSTLDKLSSGKKTLKTFFKSSSQKAVDITNLTQTIAQ